MLLPSLASRRSGTRRVREAATREATERCCACCTLADPSRDTRAAGAYQHALPVAGGGPGPGVFIVTTTPTRPLSSWWSLLCCPDTGYSTHLSAPALSSSRHAPHTSRLDDRVAPALLSTRLRLHKLWLTLACISLPTLPWHRSRGSHRCLLHSRPHLCVVHHPAVPSLLHECLRRIPLAAQPPPLHVRRVVVRVARVPESEQQQQRATAEAKRENGMENGGAGGKTGLKG